MSERRMEFLIMGAARGGTSLLTGLLDAHAELAVGFELFTPLFANREPGFPHMSEFLRSCHLEAAKHDVRWGNKMTSECLSGPLLRDGGLTLECLFAELAEVKLVHLLRDGRSVAASKMRRRGQTLQQACRDWNFAVSVYDFLLSQGHPAGVHFVRFEDLVCRPRATLEPLCRFLDVDYEDSMLAGTRSTVIPPMYRRDGLEEFRAIPPEISPEGILRLCRNLDRCGYDAGQDKLLPDS